MAGKKTSDDLHYNNFLNRMQLWKNFFFLSFGAVYRGVGGIDHFLHRKATKTGASESERNIFTLRGVDTIIIGGLGQIS